MSRSRERALGEYREEGARMKGPGGLLRLVLAASGRLSGSKSFVAGNAPAELDVQVCEFGLSVPLRLQATAPSCSQHVCC